MLAGVGGSATGTVSIQLTRDYAHTPDALERVLQAAIVQLETQS